TASLVPIKRWRKNDEFNEVLIMVLVKCPNCKEKFDVGLLFRGYRKCPNCGEKLIVSGVRKKRVEMLKKKGFFEKIFRKRDQK
ncbi:MAG: hypothetical protein KAT65_26555, partial [Methanophagales archaeon]|nr:hypothetical protein [Methanophagales archaeon]